MQRRNFISGAVAAIAGLCGLKSRAAPVATPEPEWQSLCMISNPFDSPLVLGVTREERASHGQLVDAFNGDKKACILAWKGPMGIVPADKNVSLAWFPKFNRWYITGAECD
jgi:hypothetical protein